MHIVANKRSMRLAFAATASTPPSRNNNNNKKASGGGFGSGRSSSSSSSPSSTSAAGSSSSSSKKKNKRKSSSKLDDLFQQQQSSKDDEDVVLVLDKWGLPPPTIEDIFPLMPPGTELIAARCCASNSQESSSSYTLPEILVALENCLPLPGLSKFFDVDGEQKSSTMTTYNVQKEQDVDDDDNNDDHCRKPMKLRLVHESPAVLVIDNFLTRRECLEIEQIAMPVGSSSSSSSRNQQVVEVGSALFSEGSSSAASQLTKRTSTSWFCEYKAVPQLLTAAQYVLGLPLNHMEEPQIVRYQTGQEFTWHYDQVPATTQLLANGGQRMATLLVYLNTVQEGGGTVFRDLKQARCGGEAAADIMEEEEEKHMLTVQPVQGRACIFFPATFANGKNDDGSSTTQRAAVTSMARPDDRTLHKGQVAMDEKRIVQIWIHQDTYKATLPSAWNRQEDAIPAIQQLARQRQWGQDNNIM